MAKQNKKLNHKAEDSIMYKAVIDLAILCIGVFLLQLVGKKYGFADNFDTWNTAFKWISIISAVLFAGSAVLAVSKKDRLRTVGIAAACTFGILAVCAWILFKFWYSSLPWLYFFLIAGCALYLIHLLYPRDFTLIAILTTAAGGTFYLHGWYGYTAFVTVLFYVIIAAALLATLLLAMRAVKKGGKLTLRGKTVRLFAGKSGPLPLYLTCTVWAACIVASLIFGSGFAYYCTYAAAGGLFIAACYYTIRLD